MAESDLFEQLSLRMAELKIPIAGAEATASSVRGLFDPTLRMQPPQELPTLSERLCEEHLANALVSAQQAIGDREMYFSAGEKLASLVLSITVDESAVALLDHERKAMTLRANAAEEAVASEGAVRAAIDAQKRACSAVEKSVNPRESLPIDDARRAFWIAYFARGVTSGGATLPQGWWAPTNEQMDSPWDEGESGFKLRNGSPVVDQEAELAQRAVLAGFRVSFVRAKADSAATEVSLTASKGREAVMAGLQEFEREALSIADARAQSAKEALALKVRLATHMALFGFDQQMMLHRSRSQFLLKEARERALVAEEGLRSVYGLGLPPPPVATELAHLEPLLAWTRDAATLLARFADGAIKQRISVSLAERIGEDWKGALGAGASFALSELSRLGRVVRLRDVALRFTGARMATFQCELEPPVRGIRDLDVYGVEHVDFPQWPVAITIFARPAKPLGDSVDGRFGSARKVHNVCPCGVWRITTMVPGDVDDVILDLDVSWLAAN